MNRQFSQDHRKASAKTLIVSLDKVDNTRLNEVGGKNASLGEMLQHMRQSGVRVPDGFAITADAYWYFLDSTGLRKRIAEKLAQLEAGDADIVTIGKQIRRMILSKPFPADLVAAIHDAYKVLGKNEKGSLSVAVRSSATAEDLPDASFAGQQESFLNVQGEEALVSACRRCYASLFTERSINYRNIHKFEHMKVALSVGVQHMVRADKAGAGVMFSIDTETGFDKLVLINANWGLGETVVQGNVEPDEYLVFKPLLSQKGLRPLIDKNIGAKEKKLVLGKGKPTALIRTTARERRSAVLDDDLILQLARWAVSIESHYGRPMDMEWALDGVSGELFIIQARPETVQSRKAAVTLKTYTLKKKGRCLTSGTGIGDAVAQGKICKLASVVDSNKFQDGSVLVTTMTDPDWLPVMKRAAAIVTDHGGRTSHAAIVSRELGLPAVVGTGDAMRILEAGREVTVSCAEGDRGFIYEGNAEVKVRDVSLDDIPVTRTHIMLNMANPAAALRWWQLPADGIGLARMEFIINNSVRIHPMALLQPQRVSDRKVRRQIASLTRDREDKPGYFVDTLAMGIARLAASAYPSPVIVRMSDFKTNEYAKLLGGAEFEPQEANPMLGWRGASRYYSEGYREGFGLECLAVKKVREQIGLDNVIVMIPFCRTPEEADLVLEVMANNGLRRAEAGLQVYVMAEIPANVILAEEFAQRFDGFSIGSNDLTQLILGVDRDSAQLAGIFNDRHEAVRRSITALIKSAHKAGLKVGLCGQAPSDHPDFARFLVAAGIDSISVNPDSFLAVKQHVAVAESEISRGRN